MPGRVCTSGPEPWEMTLLHHFLLDAADRAADAPALECGGVRLDFSQVARDALGLASTFRELGVRRGDRVMLFLDNSPDVVVALFASVMTGAAFVPIDPSTKAGKLRRLIEDCEPTVLVAGAAQAGAVRRASPLARSVRAILWNGAVPPDAGGCEELMLAEALVACPTPALAPTIDQDLACILYTSSSTGEPRGVMLTHHNVANTTWAIATYLQNTPDDVVLCGLPLSFDYGLYQVLTGARVGFPVVLEEGHAPAGATLERAAARGVTGLPGVPSLFASLLQGAPFDGLDLSALRYVTNAAGSLPPAEILRLRKALPGVRIICMYGVTECTRVSWLDPDRLDDKLGSVGRAMPNCEAYVLGDDGRRAPPGAVGELVVRGANVMLGYWRRPEATDRRLRAGDVPGEKVLHTGDLFRADEEGFLYHVGALGDRFRCRGLEVSPAEVEGVAREMEGVADAVALPVAHDTDVAAIRLVVAPRGGAVLTEGDVRAHCLAHLEDHLVPRFVEVWPEPADGDGEGTLRAALTGAGTVSTLGAHRTRAEGADRTRGASPGRIRVGASGSVVTAAAGGTQTGRAMSDDAAAPLDVRSSGAAAPPERAGAAPRAVRRGEAPSPTDPPSSGAAPADH